MNAVESMSRKLRTCEAAWRGFPREDNILRLLAVLTRSRLPICGCVQTTMHRLPLGSGQMTQRSRDPSEVKPRRCVGEGGRGCADVNAV